MDMDIDESRHQGRVAEVDDRGARRVRNARSDRRDVRTRDEYLAGLDEPAAGDIEQARGA
jgi:hypothetical protein